MIIFPPLRTKRISLTLREVTYGEAIGVCRLPGDRPEATATEFMRRVAADAKAPTPAYVTDPRLWTVEERARVVCHYLSQVTDTGPDFLVGDRDHLSDFLNPVLDVAVMEVALGEVAGKARVLRQLLGVHVEILERLCTERGEWMVGVIACQVHDAGVPQPDYATMTEVDLIGWVKDRIDALKRMPETEVEELIFVWRTRGRELAHFFVVDVDDQGVVFMPQDMEAGPKNPARFPALPCISEGTRLLFGRAG